MKLIIAGSRTISSRSLVNAAVTVAGYQDRVDTVVSGVARGVDLSGERWAKNHNIPIVQFHAEWNRLGRAAGPIRNQKMGDFADAAIVIWDMKSTGSIGMYRIMQSLKKPVWLFKINILQVDQQPIRYQMENGTIFDSD